MPLNPGKSAWWPKESHEDAGSRKAMRPWYFRKTREGWNCRFHSNATMRTHPHVLAGALKGVECCGISTPAALYRVSPLWSDKRKRGDIQDLSYGEECWCSCQLLMSQCSHECRGHHKRTVDFKNHAAQKVGPRFRAASTQGNRFALPVRKILEFTIVDNKDTCMTDIFWN